MLSSKIRGTLFGTLIGDCVGALFEETTTLSKGSRLVLKHFWDDLGSKHNVLRKSYTDDTALTLALARNIIQTKQIDHKVLAKNFVEEYHKNVHRNYSEHLREIFKRLELSNYEDALKPASEILIDQSDNGCAMYVAPVAFINSKDSSLESLIRNAVVVTHNNEMAINGAILQGSAISFLVKSSDKLNKEEFLEFLLDSMKYQNSPVGIPSYCEQIKHVEHLLKIENVSEERVVNVLGHSPQAIYSVPTAIYCFLRSVEISDESALNFYRNAVEYAITLGGHSNTIASMTGALCGAYCGETIVTDNICKQFEGCEMVEVVSQELSKVIQSIN